MGRFYQQPAVDIARALSGIVTGVTVIPPAVSADPLAGESVAFSGRLSSMSRREARNVVTRLGGTVADDVSAKTTMLVVGEGGGSQEDSPHDGRSISANRAASESSRRTSSAGWSVCRHRPN